jgi:hypothetical protein
MISSALQDAIGAAPLPWVFLTRLDARVGGGLRVMPSAALMKRTFRPIRLAAVMGPLGPDGPFANRRLWFGAGQWQPGGAAGRPQGRP